jgi:hypothetical protein
MYALTGEGSASAQHNLKKQSQSPAVGGKSEALSTKSETGRMAPRESSQTHLKKVRSEKTKPISVKMSVNCFVGERYESKSGRGLRENKANRRALAESPKRGRSHPEAVPAPACA